MIKFEGVKKTTTLGKLGGDGIGVSLNVNAEVTSAEYVKDADGKIKASANGNKQVKLNLKVTKEITKDDGSKVNIPNFMNVVYYETDYSPSLKSVKPTDALKKFVQVRYNTGGVNKNGESPFGSFKIRNYEGQDGSPKNSVSIFGGNVDQPKKEDGVYSITGYGGEKMVFEVDKDIKVSMKGFIPDVTDTESFMKNNYDGKNLKFQMYYMENDGDAQYDTTMPCVLENIDEDRAMKFITFVKNNADTVISARGSVKSYAIFGKDEEEASSDFGEYSYGGTTVVGYEAGLAIDFDESKNNWIIKTSKNKGTLVVDGEVADTEEEFDY